MPFFPYRTCLFLKRLQDPDTALSNELRRYAAVTILISVLSAFLLFLLFVLATTAPHPLSLFLGDIVTFMPLCFRILVVSALILLGGLLGLRIYVRSVLRRADRQSPDKQ